MSQFHRITEKYITPTLEGKTEKGKEQIKSIMENIGSQTSLQDGLAISKALIENYFLNENCSKPIIDLIEKTVLIQDTAHKLKVQNNGM